MLKIGVLSDTHLRDTHQAVRFAGILLTHWFAEVDMILHAGDVVNPVFLDLFGDLPIHAVRGNMDPPMTGVPTKKIIVAGGFRIGLIHGWGAATDLEGRLLQEFHGSAIDCLVFGHSHRPVCYRQGGILLFNPGSAADRRGAASHTIGFIEIGETLEGRIVAID